jgi:nucleolin
MNSTLKHSKLFVANLSWSVREEDLIDLFSEAGQVVSVKIPTRREDGKPRGFAFVEMATPEDGERVMERFNGSSLAGRDLVISFQDEEKAQASRQRQGGGYGGGAAGGGYGGYGGSSGGGGGGSVEKSSKLFVRNLNRSITDEDLHSLFQQAGTVLSVKVVMDRDTGESKGYAFVEMGSVDDAQSAIQQLNNRMVQNREISVNFQDPSRVKSRPNGRSGGGYGGGGGRGGYGGGGYAGSYAGGDDGGW